MKTLSLEKMESVEGSGWFDCVAMVAYGIGGIAMAASTPVTGVGMIGAGLAGVAMVQAASGCAATASAK